MDAISYLDKWKPRALLTPLPEKSTPPRPIPTRKVWSRPQQPESSPTSAETSATSSHREIRSAPPPEALKKWSRPAPPSSSNSSQISVLNSDSKPASPAEYQKVSQPIYDASQRTSFSPDSDLGNRPLEQPSRLRSPKIPRRQEFNFDKDPSEFADKQLRPQRTDSQRRSIKKGYAEGRGRFERVSKVRQSADTLLSKQTSPMPIKARRMDVFIPSTLSVAALAKLLNIKLGT